MKAQKAHCTAVEEERYRKVHTQHAVAAGVRDRHAVVQVVEDKDYDECGHPSKMKLVVDPWEKDIRLERHYTG